MIPGVAATLVAATVAAATGGATAEDLNVRVARDLARLEQWAGANTTERPAYRAADAPVASLAAIPVRAVVPPPFTPVALGDDGTVATRMVRTQRAASGLPVSLEADGHALLAGAMRVDAGASAVIDWQRVEGTRASATEMAWRGEGRVAGRAVQIDTALAFDGLMSFRLHWPGLPEDVPATPLRLVLPLKAETVTHAAWLGGGPWPVDKSDSTPPFEGVRLDTEVLKLPFTFQVTLGGERAGLALGFESTAGWDLPPDATPIHIQHAEGGPQLEVRFTQDADATRRARTIDGYLQVLPLRPWPSPERIEAFNPAQFADATPVARRQLVGGASTGSALQQARNAGLRTLVVHQGWNDVQGAALPRDPKRLDALAEFVETAKRQDLRTLVYLGREVSSASPHWADIMALARVPLRFGRRRGNDVALRPAGGAAFERALVTDTRRLLAATGAGGLFLDLVAEAEPSLNPWAGQGTIDERSNVHARLPMLENRRLMFGLYEAVRSQDPDGIIACHVDGPARPGHAFCDYMLVGEALVAQSRRSTATRLADLLPRERFRALYAPWRRGLPIVWMSKPARGGPDPAVLGALTWLHGVPQRTQWPMLIARGTRHAMMNRVEDLHQHWQLWQHSGIATAAPDAWCTPAASRALLPTLPTQAWVRAVRVDTGRAAAVVVTNPGSATLRFTVDATGLARRLGVTSVRVVEIAPDSGVAMRDVDATITLAPGRFLVLRIQATGARVLPRQTTPDASTCRITA